MSASLIPAPETMQMVLGRDGDGSSGSARSGGGGGSSARSGGGGRIPSMQLARVKDSESGGSPGPSAGGGKGKEGTGGHSWMMAIAAPMPPLHGFCLAVVGLETAMVGAAVTLVDRSAATAKEEAAAGFLGFEKVHSLININLRRADAFRAFASLKRSTAIFLPWIYSLKRCQQGLQHPRQPSGLFVCVRVSVCVPLALVPAHTPFRHMYTCSFSKPSFTGRARHDLTIH